MVLQADPAGLGFLPMGCLDHKGYKMSDPKNFYQHMILEVVSNKFNDSAFFRNDLKSVANMQPRLAPATFNIPGRNAINQHQRMNVLYSKAKNARGRVSRGLELMVKEDTSTFWEAWANEEDGSVRPKFIAVPFPKADEARYVWIDMSWPVRAILLPVAQNSYDGMHPHCVYVQLNFRLLKGDIALSGFYEDNNQEFSPWDGDIKYGLHWTSSEASMRVDIDMMYETLLLPRERRKDGIDLQCLQLHRWDNVPLDWKSENTNLKYSVDWQSRCINDDGLPLDQFLSIVNAVKLEYMPRVPSELAQTLDTVLQFGLGLVPVVGPLLAYIGSEIINAIEDPTRYETAKKIEEKFGKDMVKPLLESMMNYKKFSKKKSFISVAIAGGLQYATTFSAGQVLSLSDTGSKLDEEFDLFANTGYCNLMPMFTDQLEEFQQHPEVFASEVPADLPDLMKTLEDEKEDMPVTKKDSEAEKS